MPSYVLIAVFIVLMSAISFVTVLPLKEYAGKAPAGDVA
jgi:hypothetical protein